MWILLIVFYSTHALSSEQIFFANVDQCLEAKKAIESKYDKTFRSTVGAKCMCIEIDQ